MKTIEERALAYSEQVVNDTPFDVINGKVCVWQEDKDICEVARQAYIKGATDQKAIDEEVRLKKSDDMTDAEYNRETAFADWYCINGRSTPTFSEAIEWARKQTIDEVCEWFKTNVDWMNDRLISRLMYELRKALEE